MSKLKRAPLPTPDQTALGLDYLRLSYQLADSVRRPLQDVIADRAMELADKIYGVGRYGTSETVIMGRRGIRAGRHVAIVTDYNRITEVVSGVGAREWFPSRYEMINTSFRRVDVAADLIYRCSSSEEAEVLVDNIIRDMYEHYYGARLARMKGWAKRDITMITGTEGTTLYLGKRVSERMLRIYNKTAQLRQQMIEDTRGIIRVELELKERGITKVGDVDYITLGDTKTYALQVAAYITDMYGIELTDIQWKAPYNPRLDEADWQRTLAWVQKMVLPSLLRLNEIVPAELKRLGISVSGKEPDTFELPDEQA